VTLPKRADQDLFLEGFLVTMLNSAVFLGLYTMNSSFNLFFLNLGLLWVYLSYLSVLGVARAVFSFQLSTSTFSALSLL
jgi:hypothetical protein